MLFGKICLNQILPIRLPKSCLNLLASENTYQLLKNDSQFSFEYRGKISAKDKGEIDMYFVDLKKITV